MLLDVLPTPIEYRRDDTYVCTYLYPIYFEENIQAFLMWLDYLKMKLKGFVKICLFFYLFYAFQLCYLINSFTLSVTIAYYITFISILKFIMNFRSKICTHDLQNAFFFLKEISST